MKYFFKELLLHLIKKENMFSFNFQREYIIKNLFQFSMPIKKWYNMQNLIINQRRENVK